MIYSEEDYKDAAKYKHSFDIDQVAKEIEKRSKQIVILPTMDT